MFLLLSTLLLSPASFAVVCHEGYAKLPPLRELAPSSLPSQQQILQAFTQRQRAWDQTFRAGPFWRMLNRVTRDPAAAHDYFASFEKLENSGRELIRAHRLFSAAQSAPLALEKFVADLAALNAAVKGNRPKNELKELGEKAKNSLRPVERPSSRAFQAARPELLEARVAGIPARLDSMLAEGMTTPAKIGQAAEDLAALLVISHARSRPGALLETVTGEMQELHQRLRAQAADFSYTDQKVFLSPLLREELEKLRNSLSSSGAPRK